MHDETQEFIPLAVPDLAGNEESYVLQAVRSSWISSSGEFLNRAEAQFAALCDTSGAVMTCNGTVALHLALLALDAAPGDEVIVPSLTYIATANAVRYVGATPIFADVDEDTWCISPASIEAAITPRTRGIIAVHLYGHPADMDAINAIAAKHGLWVVEDAAEAHLAKYKGRLAGSLADVGTFSFYGNKTLTSGEGGALTLSNRALEQKIRLLRGQGMDPARRYYFPVVGYNYRMTNIAAALLCAQLERAPQIVERRRAILNYYEQHLAGVRGLGFQPRATWATPTPWLFCLTVDPAAFGRSRDQVMAGLQDAGIETRPFFIPIHTLPPYQADYARRPHDLVVTEKVAASGLNLPTHNLLQEPDLARICRVIQCLAR